MRITLTILTLLVVLFTAALAAIIRADSFQVTSDGDNIVVRWITDDETNVSRFDIERRTGTDGNFTSIATVNPKGPSLYEYTDYSPFHKTVTLYQYRIKVSFVDGSTPLYVGPVTVSHTVSGVRRTWGSIKAMFR
jgi:hypothetical protein